MLEVQTLFRRLRNLLRQKEWEIYVFFTDWLKFRVFPNLCHPFGSMRGPDRLTADRLHSFPHRVWSYWLVGGACTAGRGTAVVPCRWRHRDDPVQGQIRESVPATGANAGPAPWCL